MDRRDKTAFRDRYSQLCFCWRDVPSVCKGQLFCRLHQDLYETKTDVFLSGRYNNGNKNTCNVLKDSRCHRSTPYLRAVPCALIGLYFPSMSKRNSRLVLKRAHNVERTSPMVVDVKFNILLFLVLWKRYEVFKKRPPWFSSWFVRLAQV